MDDRMNILLYSQRYDCHLYSKEVHIENIKYLVMLNPYPLSCAVEGVRN